MKTTAKRRWGHWTTNTFAANECNSLDLSLREAASLSSFKRNPSTVTLKVPVNKNILTTYLYVSKDRKSVV